MGGKEKRVCVCLRVCVCVCVCDTEEEHICSDRRERTHGVFVLRCSFPTPSLSLFAAPRFSRGRGRGVSDERIVVRVRVVDGG